MPSHRQSKRASSSSSSRRRSVVRQNGVQLPQMSSNVSSVTVKRDPRDLSNGMGSMSSNYSGRSGHPQLTQQQHYGGEVAQPVEPDLHTPQQNHSYNAFGTPVDLSGATMLSQGDYQGITGSISSSAINSFRQGNGEGSNNTSFQMDTPSHHSFANIGPQTPAPRAATPEPSSQPPPPRSFPGYMSHQPAIEVVKSVRTQNFRIDGTVCKKLAIEPACRNPEQRVQDRVLNMGRRGNAEALLCQITGQEAANACKNCKRGHGPWVKCVVYPGLFYGSCSNCWFNASGSRCTFQESNHHPLHHIYASMAPSYNSPFPLNNGHSSQTYSAGGPVTHNTPVPVTAPANATRTNHRDGLLSHVAAPFVPAPSAGVPHIGQATTSSHPADRDIVSSHSMREMSEGMVGDASTWGIRARHLVRIQAAASELGMRLGEYDEFLAFNNLTDFGTNVSSTNGENHDSAEAEGPLDQSRNHGVHAQHGVLPDIEKHDADMTESEHGEGSEDGDHRLHGLQSPTLD